MTHLVIVGIWELFFDSALGLLGQLLIHTVICGLLSALSHIYVWSWYKTSPVFSAAFDRSLLADIEADGTCWFFYGGSNRYSHRVWFRSAWYWLGTLEIKPPIALAQYHPPCWVYITCKIILINACTSVNMSGISTDSDLTFCCQSLVGGSLRRPMNFWWEPHFSDGMPCSCISPWQSACISKQCSSLCGCNRV